MAIKDTTKEEVVGIIFSILLIAGVLVVAATMPSTIQLFKYFGRKKPHEQWRIRRSVSRLEKNGIIRKRFVGGQECFVLTPSGKERAMRYKLRSMTINPQKKWDGLWRIVMFDISEDKRSARRAIGHAIQKLGCLQYQKSVFITPYPCAEEIDFAGECFGVRKHIRLITAKQVDGIEEARKHFLLFKDPSST